MYTWHVVFTRMAIEKSNNNKKILNRADSMSYLPSVEITSFFTAHTKSSNHDLLVEAS